MIAKPKLQVKKVVDGCKPCRPGGKHPQMGCGAGHSQYRGIGSIYIPKGLPMRAKPIYIKTQAGGNSPFMLTNNSSFNSIKLR